MSWGTEWGCSRRPKWPGQPGLSGAGEPGQDSRVVWVMVSSVVMMGEPWSPRVEPGESKDGFRSARESVEGRGGRGEGTRGRARAPFTPSTSSVQSNPIIRGEVK